MPEAPALPAEAEAAHQIAARAGARRAPAPVGRAWRLRPARVAMHAVLIVGVVAMVGPLVWMVLTSLKTQADAEAFFDTPRRLGAVLRSLWPHPLTWDNYRAVFTERPMLRYFLNSAIYTGLRIVPSLLLCSLAGFVFAKMRFRGRETLFMAIIVTMMVPFQIKMLVLYEMMVQLGWVNTYWAVAVVGLMEPLGIFLFRQAIRDIPDALIDAAHIDGCGPLRTYFSVALPLIRPTLAAYSIFLFMWSWSDFLWPLIVLNSEKLKPVEVGILSFSDINNPEYVKMMAAATVAVAPVVVFFLFMQRQFIQGVTMSGVKG